MDFERDRLRNRLRLCQVGFVLSSIGLGLLCFNEACSWGSRIFGQRELWEIVNSRWWSLFFGAAIPWTTLIGSYFFWGRSADPSWQRRAGLLVIMNGIDAYTWFLMYGHAFGLGVAPAGPNWLLFELSNVLGWVEFMLFASLAADMLRELGNPAAAEQEAATRWLSTVGLVLWILLFVAFSSWGGRPPRNFRILRDVLLAAAFVRIATSFQVTVLAVAAGRQCARARIKLNDEADEHELLRSPSERDGEDPFAWLEHQRKDDPWH